MNSRIALLKNSVQSSQPSVCPERAIIWTQYFKNKKNLKTPKCIQIAEALSKVLQEKSIKINEQELLVGNFSSYRVGGSIYPELHGIPVLMDLFKFRTRKINPLHITKKAQWDLLKIIPFWLVRFLGFRAFPTLKTKYNFLKDQLNPRFYVINESGGIAHLAPDYEKVIENGLDYIIGQAQNSQKKFKENSEEWSFLQSSIIICQGVIEFADRYRRMALSMALKEKDIQRKHELLSIANTLEQVPKNKATSMQEALQSALILQITISLESLDNGISPGRMDQYLSPFYNEQEHEKVKELIACFCIKTSEIIPVFSTLLTEIHGGLMNGQVVTVGGVDPAGNDATNPLTSIFLEVIDFLRMRQPNFHARIHKKSPKKYLQKMYKMLLDGATSPALYNDELIISIMKKQGYSLKDARNYIAIGCVEPACPGKSFASTDAALFNVPAVLELALNEGKLFNSSIQTGVKTAAAKDFTNIQDVKKAFLIQLENKISQLISDLSTIEVGNKELHPTPLTSSLLEGCIEKGLCSTAGGATYNFSGIQCVGPTDAGDALYAIEQAVFNDKKLTMKALIQILKTDFKDNENIRKFLKSLPKFGNDQEAVDQYTKFVLDSFYQALYQKKNTRNGYYTMGVYSMTSHQYFGGKTAAMAHGRNQGQPFASGLAPGHGCDRLGPTALLNSMNRIDQSKATNGINFNIKFDSGYMKGSLGISTMEALIGTYFSRGGMQVQANILDPNILLEAKENPELHPNLLVRVSGYSSYFHDLSPKIQDELIQRTTIR